MLHPLKKITQKEFEKLLRKATRAHKETKTVISLKALLQQHGFMETLENIDFCIPGLTVKHSVGVGAKTLHGKDILKQLDYSDVHFNHCHFTGCDLSNTTFQRSDFTQCDFTNTIMQACNFTKTHFQQCQFQDTLLMRSTFQEHTTLKECTFSNVDFYKAHFQDTSALTNSILKECVFIGSPNTQATCKKSRFQDCIFDSNASLFKNGEKSSSDPAKPIIGLLWHTHEPGHSAHKVYTHLKEKGAIPIRISYLADGEIDLGEKNTGLDGEVKNILAHHEQSSQHKEYQQSSRAMRIIKEGLEHANKNPNIHKIIHKAAVYGTHLDGIILPGGADIPSDLYGQAPDPRAAPEQNYMRSVLEFAVIADQKKRGNPIMGICRGFQILNVYHGGDMVQRVADAGNFKSIRPIQAKKGTTGIIPEIMKKNMWTTTMSVHRQAIDKIGDGLHPGGQLEIIAEYNGIVKAAQEKYGAPILMTQFHPEFYNETASNAYASHKGHFKSKVSTLTETLFLNTILSKNNDDFIGAIIDTAKTRNKKKSFIDEIKELRKERDKKKTTLAHAEPTLKPSSIHQDKIERERIFSPEAAQRLIQDYLEQNKKEGKTHRSRFHFIKKMVSKINTLFNKNSLAKKEKIFISSLESALATVFKKEDGTNQDFEGTGIEKKKARNRIDNLVHQFYTENPKSALSILAHHYIQTHHKHSFVSDKVKSFLINHPEHELSQAIKTFVSFKGNKIPENENELLSIITLHAQTGPHHTDVLRTKTHIEKIYIKQVIDTAHLLSKGEDYEAYNKKLNIYLKRNNGNYPLTSKEWHSFKNTLPTMKDIPVTNAFIYEVESLLSEIEKQQTALGLPLDNQDSEKENLKEQLQENLNTLLATIMKGPAYSLAPEGQLLIDTYLKENNNVLPADMRSWEKFKASLPKNNLSNEMTSLVNKIERMQLRAKKDIRDSWKSFIRKNPDHALSKELDHYKKEHKSFPIILEEVNTFLKQHIDKKVDTMLNNKEVADLLQKIQKSSEKQYHEIPKTHYNMHQFSAHKSKKKSVRGLLKTLLKGKKSASAKSSLKTQAKARNNKNTTASFKPPLEFSSQQNLKSFAPQKSRWGEIEKIIQKQHAHHATVDISPLENTGVNVSLSKWDPADPLKSYQYEITADLHQKGIVLHAVSAPSSSENEQTFFKQAEFLITGFIAQAKVTRYTELEIVSEDPAFARILYAYAKAIEQADKSFPPDKRSITKVPPVNEHTHNTTPDAALEKHIAVFKEHYVQAQQAEKNQYRA